MGSPFVTRGIVIFTLVWLIQETEHLVYNQRPTNLILSFVLTATTGHIHCGKRQQIVAPKMDDYGSSLVVKPGAVANHSYEDTRPDIPFYNTQALAGKFKRRAKDSCPVLCRCFTHNNAFTADCQARGLKGVPEGLDFGTKTLVLESNPGIQILPDRVFRERGAINIQVLSASRCSVHFIGAEAFHGLRFLRVLDLSRNALTTIPSPAFGDTPFLKTLILSNNPVRRIPTSAFAHCSRLQVLELDRCSIKWIEKGAFEGLYQLQSLKIRSNALHSLNPDIFRPLIQLVFLDASGNSWTCDCRMLAFKEWTMEQGSNKAFAMDALPMEADSMRLESGSEDMGKLASKTKAPHKKGGWECCSFPKHLRNRQWANLKLEELVCGPLLLEEVHATALGTYDKGSYLPWIVRPSDASNGGPNASAAVKDEASKPIKWLLPDGKTTKSGIRAHKKKENFIGNSLCDKGNAHQKTLSMECLTSGYPTPKVMWYFERQLIIPNSRYASRLIHQNQIKRVIPKHTVLETTYHMEPFWNLDYLTSDPPSVTEFKDDSGEGKSKEGNPHSFNYIFPSKIRHLPQDHLTHKANNSIHNPESKTINSLRHPSSKVNNKYFLWMTNENGVTDSREGHSSKRNKSSLSPSLILDQIMLNPQAYKIAVRSTLKIECFDPELDKGVYECIALGNTVEGENILKTWPRKWYYVSPDAEIIPVSGTQLKYVQTLTSSPNDSMLPPNKRYPHQNKDLTKALRNLKNTGGLHTGMSRDYRGSGNAWTESRRNGVFAPTNKNGVVEKTASLQDITNTPTSTLYIVAIVGTSCIILFVVVFLICCLKFQRKFQAQPNKGIADKRSDGTKKKMKAKLKKKCLKRENQNDTHFKKRISGDEMENSMTSNHNGGFLEDPTALPEVKEKSGNGHLKSYTQNGCPKQLNTDHEMQLIDHMQGLHNTTKCSAYKGSHTLSKMFNKSPKKDKIVLDSSPTEIHRSRSVVGHLCKISASPFAKSALQESGETTNTNSELINISNSPSSQCENRMTPVEGNSPKDLMGDTYHTLSNRNLLYQPVDIFYPNACSSFLKLSKELVNDHQNNIVYTHILGGTDMHNMVSIEPNGPINDRTAGHSYLTSGKLSHMSVNGIGAKNNSMSSFVTSSMTTLEPDNNPNYLISDSQHRLIQQPLDLRELRSVVDRGSLFDVFNSPGGNATVPPKQYIIENHKNLASNIDAPINGMGYHITKTDYSTYYDRILSLTPTEVYSLDPRSHHMSNANPLNLPESWYPYQNIVDVSNSKDDAGSPNASHIVLSERTTVV